MKIYHFVASFTHVQDEKHYEQIDLSWLICIDQAKFVLH